MGLREAVGRAPALSEFRRSKFAISSTALSPDRRGSSTQAQFARPCVTSTKEASHNSSRSSRRPCRLRSTRVGYATMAWTEPAYSRSRVNQAGRTLVDPAARTQERAEALIVINNWRSSHSFPLNTMQTYLRRKAGDFDPESTTAQRIKRLPSIRHKLERMPNMSLARMHDIGGGRAVLDSVDAVDGLVTFYTEQSQFKHKLVRHDAYIAEPKPSGYRGVHLVYAYNSDRKPTYNELRIELQLRSRLQHAWATAVETVGTFNQQALKSSWGEEAWLRFFALMGSALALREGTPLVPGTLTGEAELVSELREYVDQLDVRARLSAYSAAVQYTERMSERKGHTFLLELDTQERALSVRSYEDRVVAVEEYSSLERDIEHLPHKDVVLVTVESVAALRSAYPNYFLDTTAFLASVEQAIS